MASGPVPAIHCGALLTTEQFCITTLLSVPHGCAFQLVAAPMVLPRGAAYTTNSVPADGLEAPVTCPSSLALSMVGANSAPCGTVKIAGLMSNWK